MNAWIRYLNYGFFYFFVQCMIKGLTMVAWNPKSTPSSLIITCRIWTAPGQRGRSLCYTSPQARHDWTRARIHVLNERSWPLISYFSTRVLNESFWMTGLLHSKLPECPSCFWYVLFLGHGFGHPGPFQFTQQMFVGGVYTSAIEKLEKGRVDNLPS